MAVVASCETAVEYGVYTQQIDREERDRLSKVQPERKWKEVKESSLAMILPPFYTNLRLETRENIPLEG